MTRTRLSLVAWLAAAALVGVTAHPLGGPGATQSPVPAAQGATPPRPPASGTGIILGQVVDGGSGSPIGGALVTMTMTVAAQGRSGVGAPAGGRGAASAPIGRAGGPAPGASSMSLPTQRVIADGSGRFVFHDLPKGNATISASAPGYLGGGYGARRINGPTHPVELDEGQRVPDATIRLWKYGVITGLVTDEFGDGLPSVQVRVLRRITSSNQRRWASSSSATTDDRGQYRIASLTPGDYLVVVTSSVTSVPVSSIAAYEQLAAAGGNEMQQFMRGVEQSQAPVPGSSGYRVGDVQVQPQPGSGLSRVMPPPTADGHLSVYPTTFYANAVTSAQAQVITLGSGDERAGVDFPMRLVPATRVTGVVTGPGGPAANFGLHLFPLFADEINGDNPYEAARTVTDAVGQFAFLGVPPGQYQLRALKTPPPQAMDAMSVNVRVVNGQVMTTPTPSTPAPAQEPTLWAQASVSVGDTDVSGVLLTLREGARVTGRFEFDGTTRPTPQQIAQGSVNLSSVSGQSNGGTGMARASQDGSFATTGVLPGPYRIGVGTPPGWMVKSIVFNGKDISLAPFVIDNDMPGVVITLTDRGGKIICGLSGTVPKDTTPVIVMFPANYAMYADLGLPGALTRSTRLGLDKHATLANLRSGDYFVAAVPDDLLNDWTDPKILDAIARDASRVSVEEGAERTVDVKLVVIR